MLISIIMPAYNAEKNIKSALDSILNQTYENWELIVVDDGSSDNTLKIIEKYVGCDKRIKSYPNQTNVGVSETRNNGITHIKGNWVAFLDSDDIWHKDKLDKQIDLIRKTDAKFVFTAVEYIDEKGIPFPGIFEVPDKVDFRKLLRQNVISTSSVVLNKRLLTKHKMENDAMHEDYALWLEILKEYRISAYGLNETLVTYRISRDSKSGNKFKSFKMTYLVHRHIKNNPISSLYYTVNHLLRSLKKYYKILHKKG